MRIAFAQKQEFQRGGDVVLILDHQHAGAWGGHPAPSKQRAIWGLVRGRWMGKLAQTKGYPVIDLIQSQLLDPLRLGLIVALVFTMFRTRAATGTIIPLAAGVVFVAVILPLTQGAGTASLAQAVAAGIVSNLIILGIVLALAMIVRRLRG